MFVLSLAKLEILAGNLQKDTLARTETFPDPVLNPRK